jgi:hypothetical protein
MHLPAEVADLSRRHLDLADEAAPELVSGLYLTGSVALADFCPAVSDVDFVAVVQRVPTDADFDALRDLNARLGTQRLYDGFYIQPTGPGRAPAIVARSHDGIFTRDGPGEQLSPLAWFELSRYGLAVRGPAATTFGQPDDAVVRAWLLDNLASYWMTRVAQLDPLIADRDGEVPTYGQSVSWFVLGPPRLHATLMTGRIISKTAAADHVAEHFPAWAELAERCRRYRHGGPDSFLTRDLVDAFRLTRHVRGEAEIRWG